MEVHSIEEFLDDRKFITEKQKATYLKDGVFRGNYKSAIKRAFERYYTSFTWLRKKKGCPLQFELGAERNQYIENDKRTSRQNTKIAEIVRQALINFMNSIFEKDMNELSHDNHIKNGYYYNTSFSFSFDLALLNPALYRMKNEYINMDSEQELNSFNGDIDELISNVTMRKNYLNVVQCEWLNVFKQVLKKPEFKGNFKRCNMLVFKKEFYNKETDKTEAFYPQRIMTDSEQEKFNLFKKELNSRSDVERPNFFKRTNEKTQLYKYLQESFLMENFEADSTYEMVCIKIKKYPDSVPADIQAFSAEFKQRTDKRLAKMLCNKVKKKIHGEMINFNYVDSTDLFYALDHELASAKNELKKFHKLDERTEIVCNTKEITNKIFDDTYNKLANEISEKENRENIDLSEILDLFQPVVNEKKQPSNKNLRAA